MYLLEELASQGFIVAAVDHPYGSGTTVFPDGRRLRAPSHGYLSFTSAEELRATHAYVDQQLEIRIADIRFLVETLSKHDEANPFARTGNAFGIVGYSFGGTAAAALCSRGTRIQACVNIDGLLFDNLGSPNEVPWPFLHVISKAEPLAPGSRNQLPELEAMAQANTEALMTHAVDYSGSYVVSVSGARHDDFLDRPFFSLPVPNRAMQALTMYASDYLRTRLLNQPAPLLAKGAKPTHPSVFVQRREAPVP
ncbi:hypothetical protein F183_A28980 [Bryobacterales bacterium F-183]|nr:hypothetical protein F183_A28980 [Bryobacterales bacterium F-183]